MKWRAIKASCVQKPLFDESIRFFITPGKAGQRTNETTCKSAQKFAVSSKWDVRIMSSSNTRNDSQDERDFFGNPLLDQV